MDVALDGRVIEYDKLEAGTLFIVHHAAEFRVCLKVRSNGGDPEYPAVVLMPPLKDYGDKPGIVAESHFSGLPVLALDAARVWLRADRSALVATSAEHGDIICRPIGDRHLVVLNNKSTLYIDLKTGHIIKPFMSSKTVVYRKWSIVVATQTGVIELS
jgi:hypothetical protein